MADKFTLIFQQNLKRKEIEFELEMHKFVHQKIVLQEKITQLKAELNKMNIDVDINAITAAQDQDNETNSTSTATGTQISCNKVIEMGNRKSTKINRALTKPEEIGRSFARLLGESREKRSKTAI